ncbi:MAG: hypothetical protein WC375_09835 [Methanomassiliicoccales archaeon]|jgi:predicted protein tyrosine phosphatase
MISTVKVLNRLWLEGIARGEITGLPERWYLISIYTNPSQLFLTDSACISLRRQGCVGMLPVMFADATESNFEAVKTKEPHTVLFGDNEARQIMAFIQGAKRDTQPAVLIVHCDAGVSRSGAIGTWINDFLEMDYSKFKKNNPYIQPNPHVLKKMRDISGMNDKWFGGKQLEIIPQDEKEIIIPNSKTL